MRSLLLVPALLSLVAAPASPQRLPAPFPTLRDQASQFRPALSTARRSGSPVATVFGEVLGGTAGLLGGAALGASMESPCHCDDPGLEGAIYGGLIGETVGLALGAHLGDGLRGNLGLDLLASAGGALVSLAIVTGASSGAAVIPAAALHMALVAGVELANARSKPEAP